MEEVRDSKTSSGTQDDSESVYANTFQLNNRSGFIIAEVVIKTHVITAPFTVYFIITPCAVAKFHIMKIIRFNIIIIFTIHFVSKFVSTWRFP